MLAMKPHERCLSRDSVSEPLHANSGFHGRRCAHLSGQRPILRGPNQQQEQEGVYLTPTKAIFYSVGNRDARSSVQIYDEITARGFTGSAPLLEIRSWQS